MGVVGLDNNAYRQIQSIIGESLILKFSFLFIFLINLSSFKINLVKNATIIRLTSNVKLIVVLLENVYNRISFVTVEEIATTEVTSKMKSVTKYPRLKKFVARRSFVARTESALKSQSSAIT